MTGIGKLLRRAIHSVPALRGQPVVVVSGLPRSGTSMMMKMLDAGGLPTLTDGLRQADADNPGGYYELEQVKDLKESDRVWLADARGKAVKVISELLSSLPAEFDYRVIFMRRNLSEVLASQREMLRNRGETPRPTDDSRMRAVYVRHLARVERWLAHRPNVETLYLDYADVLARPLEGAGRVQGFLGSELDVERMAAVVDPNLYRQRGGEVV